MIPISDDNPARTRPVVTILLIEACVAIFLWETSLGPEFDSAVGLMGLTPNAFTHPGETQMPSFGVPVWLTLLTTMFLHAGWLHLGGNMLYLWIFGNNIEDAMGHGKYTLFYFASGIAVGLSLFLAVLFSLLFVVGAFGVFCG